MQAKTTEASNEPALLPASFAQQRLWFLDRFEGGGALYNVPASTRLRGPLDTDALGRAIDALVERHESLRTVFTLREGVPHQEIRAPVAHRLSVVDLSEAPDAEQRGLALASEQARASFDLSRDDLFRATLIKLADEDHLLTLVLHHIITDGWSMGVLRRELSTFYSGFAQGREVQMQELAIQYADYAVWQQQWLESGGLDQQLKYWSSHLAGAPSLLELGTDRPRPARQSFRGATVRTIMPADLLEGVRALGEREGATLFMTLLAAYAVLLSRYSSQERVVIASPVANRGRSELEGVIGFFVNTLALSLEAHGEQSFIEMVRQARETALGAFSNQDLPFEKLVEHLNPERHMSHAPVAQVLFVVQNALEKQETFPGLEEERVLTERGTAKFDLSLFAAETAEGLRVSLEYCTDLFEEATALRMLEHYRVLLEELVSDPSRPIGELSLSSERERDLLLGTWSQGAESVAAGSSRPIHELVCEQAARTPDAPALISAAGQLSYAQLESRANRLARRLVELGVGPGVVVGICAERSTETATAVLGVLKAGGAYAPIDPAYPAERVAFMLADTDAPVLLTQQHLLATLPDHRAQTVCLDADDQALPELGDDAEVHCTATLEDLGYVLYTSGSTGRPKGVAMGQRALANLLAWQLQSFSQPTAARTLQFASLSFDVAFQEIFSTWCSGGTLVLIDDATRRDPEALLRFIAAQQIERLFLPFVALQNLCETAARLEISTPSLREVITAGEQLKVTEAVRGFFIAHPSCTLVNQYGPTESHVVSAFTLSGPAERWPALPPIGRPIAGAELYLLDARLQPVPIGVPGELHIGGRSLARGYLNRPELTDERFIAHPFSQARGARLYRTGDLARHLPDGNIEYIGRTDHQLKVRGFRIEPGEIEAALRGHPAISEALVDAREDDGGEKRLVAYLIAEPGACDVQELRTLLGGILPDYMIPSAFVFLDAFPLTPNGKVDRARLALTPLGGEAHTRERVAPRTETERRLAEIWSKLLGVDEIGVNENFFELGGHSLMAVRLFTEIERKLHVQLPIAALFETATIAGLAEALERTRGADPVAWSSLVQLQVGNGQRPLFLVGVAGGELLPYRELVEHLDPGLPIFGLRAPGVDRVTRPLARVEELAAHYVEEVRAVQPRGPYRLGGFCFSGLVAYEMARLLRGAGEELELLALIDSYPQRPKPAQSRVELERDKLKAFRQAGLREKRDWAWSRLRSATYLKIGPRVFEALEARGLQHVLPRRPLNVVFIASNLARQRYKPSPLDVRVNFFRAQKAPDAQPTPWEEIAGRGVELRQIVAPDIRHDRMMHDPHVKVLAAEMASALRRAAQD